MTPEQEDLVERLREALANEKTLREVSMFGGRSFMVAEKMLVAARKDGGLLVRVDPERHDELVALPGASMARMGKDREMGPGWVEVEPAALVDDRKLDFWLDVAFQFHRGSRRVAQP